MMADALPNATFRFVAEGVSLSALPMERVARYLSLLSDLLGSTGKVHLTAATNGSAVFAVAAEAPAVPSVRERLAEARRPDGGGPRAAWRALDQALADDGATGTLTEERKGGIVVPFPGVTARADTLPAFWQPGELRGRLIELKGRDDTKHGAVMSAAGSARFECSDALAMRLRAHLFDFVRLAGRGRWQRDGAGAWNLLAFKAETFDVLRNDSISDVAAKLRAEGGLGLAAEDEVSRKLVALR